MNDAPARSRPRLLLALLGTVLAALASRRWPLPGVLAEHTGDALYATAMASLLALLRPRAPAAALAVAAFALSALVECSQLLHPDWLLALRRTLPGRLLLGQGFQWADLLAYALGAALALALDAGLTRRRSAPASRAGPPAAA